MDDAIKMKDAITISRVKLLHPKIIGYTTSGIENAEAKLGQYISIRIVQGWRSFAEQTAIYAIGRTIKGSGVKPGLPMGQIVTRAKAGQSPHNFGLAVDFAILYDKDKNGTFEDLSWDMVADMNRDGESDWKEVVDSFKAIGFQWGGDWKGGFVDDPHFEMTFGHSESDLLQKYNNGDFIPGTKFVHL